MMMIYRLYINSLYTILLFFTPFSALARLRLFPKFPTQTYDVLIHATSIGEVMLAVEMLKKVGSSKTYYITTSTETSYKYLSNKVEGMNNVGIGYLPIDTRSKMKQLVKKGGFKRLIIIEHDVWPNLLKVCEKKGIARYLLNAYLKEKDYENYHRFSWVTPLFFNFNEIYVQSDSVAKQFSELKLYGTTTVYNIGNLKYMVPTPKNIVKWKTFKEKVVTLGSFHDTEEKMWLESVREAKDYTLVVIPRYLHLVSQWEESFSVCGEVVLYSQYDPSQWSDGEKMDVLIVDVFGVAKDFYSMSDVVVIGDSFRSTMGGHNIFEPLALKKPVIYGKNLKTFSDIAPVMEKKEVAFRCDIQEVEEILNRLLSDAMYYNGLTKRVGEVLSEITFDEQKLMSIFIEI